MIGRIHLKFATAPALAATACGGFLLGHLLRERMVRHEFQAQGAELAQVYDSPELVAKAGHVLPIRDRHLTISLDKRSRGYILLIRPK